MYGCLFLLVVLAFAVTIGVVLRQARKLDGLERRLENLELAAANQEAPSVPARPAPVLTQAPAPSAPMPPVPVQAGVAPPAPAHAPAAAPPARVTAPEPAAQSIAPPSTAASRPPTPPVAVPPTPRAEKLGDQLRAAMGGEEWEAIVGGSWLNKIGVGVLVIGVALLLGYSFARMGPAGRVSMGLAISLGMLALGMWVERRERYVVFARGLIGGGWAALYFTAYAMHGLEAARVIDSAFAGMILLTAVAVGMIGHSLRYRSQLVTGLGYFLAFVALSLGGAPGFSLVALIPLAASLLVVTRRFSWSPMMLAGLGLTYGTYLIAASGAPPPAFADFVRAESVLAVYWLLFEAFDLIEFRRGRISPSTAALSPLNAVAFLSISLLQWTSMTPDTVYVLFGATGVLYALSAVARAILRGPSTFGERATVIDRAMAGSYEVSVTLAAGLLAWASGQRFEGLQLALAFFVEAEVLFMLGRALGQPYLRWLGTVLMAAPLAQITRVVTPTDATVATLGLRMHPWIPLTFLLAVVFYANRAFARGRKRLMVERAYNPLASALIMIVLADLVSPSPWLSVAWFAAALVYFEIGSRTAAGEFRLHAYVAIALALVSVFTTNIITDWPRQWQIPALVGALCYGFALRQVFGPHRAPEDERDVARILVAIPGSLLAAIVCWMVVPAEYLGLASLALAIVWYEVAARTQGDDFRFHAYVIAAQGLGLVVANNVLDAEVRQWAIPTAAAAFCYALAARQVYGSNRIALSERKVVRTALTIPATALISTVCWIALPDPYLRLAWLALAAALFELGANSSWTDLKIEAYVVGAGSIVAMTSLDVVNVTTVTVAGLMSMTGAIALLTGWYLRISRRPPIRLADSPAERNLVGSVCSASALFFTGGLVWHAATYPLIAIGWAAAALLAIEVGTNLRDRALRGQGHAAMAIALGRLAFANFPLTDVVAGWSYRLLTVLPMVVVCYYLSRRMRSTDSSTTSIERTAAPWYLWIAVVLVAVVTAYDMSAQALTVAWGVEAAVIVVFGFVAHERALRLAGLLLLAVCIVKLFALDFRGLDAMSRIVSFIVLGVLLVAASWLYTRYRDQLHKIL